ncbi:KpsF/GutQ family sugar-phosphate isomerase [Cochlodiniinecator piscidefendens]|uniref:KpsF/GutQ family sugar-phosphate isomerase n=1 Tax=Cochlodiniinecator piscidefendens TaxID=2715756 RepID=UPI00197C3D37
MPTKNDFSPLQSVQESLSVFQDGLKQTLNSVSEPELAAIISDAAQVMFEMKGRLILSGVGKSGHIARKLAATFSSTGTPAYFVHAAEASHGDLGMIQSSDVLVLMSWSGETRELSDIIAYGLRFDVPIIAITGKAESTLARKAQFPIVLPRAEEACPHNLAPTTSTLLQLAIGDALAVTLLRMRGFSEESFRNFHPGGKLGSVLQPISEFMHKGDQLPLLPETAPIIEVISEISNKGFGIVGLQNADGHLVGVVTDGDIRRYLEKNTSGTMQAVIWSATAAQLMTPNSVTLDQERLSARALNIMQTNRITAAFVVEDEKPVGLITVLQLLQRGVA